MTKNIKTITARFSSTCRACNAQVTVGATLKSSRIGWIHVGCDYTNPAPAPIKAATPKPPQEKLEPGVYETTEDRTDNYGNTIAAGVFVVKFNKERTNLYAKRLVELNGDYRTTEIGEHVAIDFEYARGAVFALTAADRMPLERAKNLITLYGRCIACGRFLKAKQSVEQGIGPVCIKYFGSPLNVKAETADGRIVRVSPRHKNASKANLAAVSRPVGDPDSGFNELSSPAGLPEYAPLAGVIKQRIEF